MMNERLINILKHAFDTVPFYMKLKEKNGNNYTKFEDLPLISKKYMIENLENFLSNEVSNYNRTTDLNTTDNKALIFEYTSGSSGYPLQCYKTIKERSQFGLSLYKKRKSIYKDFSNDKMFCFIHNPDDESNPYIRSLGNLSESNIGRLLAYLRDEVKPKVLHGNTMLLLYYADYVKKHNFDLKDWYIEFIEQVSEGITQEQKDYIGKQFRTRVYNCYGCLECYNMAYECKSELLHLNENVIIEIIDLDTQKPVQGYGKEGEIVLTSLVNKAQPFIRYKTGDIGYIENSECECGNKNNIIHLTGKRKLDYIKLIYKTENKELHICGYDIFTTIMHRLITTGYDYVSWYNVIQKELDVFDVLYIRKKNFSDSFFELFKKYAEEELNMKIKINFFEKTEEEVLLINKKNKVFKSELQSD